MPAIAAARISLRDKVVVVVLLAALLGGFGYTTSHYSAPSGEEADAADAKKLYGQLPPDPLLANAEFRVRVESEFPILTPEDAMVRKLEGQGFKRDAWSAKRMSYRRFQTNRSLRCGFTASVTWESDDQGRVSALDPLFLRALGCVERAS